MERRTACRCRTWKILRATDGRRQQMQIIVVAIAIVVIIIGVGALSSSQICY